MRTTRNQRGDVYQNLDNLLLDGTASDAVNCETHMPDTISPRKT